MTALATTSCCDAPFYQYSDICTHCKEHAAPEPHHAAEDYDPTPWCRLCGAMEAANCHCPPDADFVEDLKRLEEERTERETALGNPL